MSQKLVIVGLAVLGLVVFSPKIRHNLAYFLEQLAAEQRKKAQRIETERRAALESESINQIQLPHISPPDPALSGSLMLTAEQLALPAPREPDARWRDVLVTPAVALVLGKRGSGKTALAYRLLELFRYRLTP